MAAKSVVLPEEVHRKLKELAPVEAERINVSRLGMADFINRLLDEYAKKVK